MKFVIVQKSESYTFFSCHSISFSFTQSLSISFLFSHFILRSLNTTEESEKSVRR